MEGDRLFRRIHRSPLDLSVIDELRDTPFYVPANTMITLLLTAQRQADKGGHSNVCMDTTVFQVGTPIRAKFAPNFEPPCEHTEAEFGFRKRPASKSNFHPGREHFFRQARCHLGRPKFASFPRISSHFWTHPSTIFGQSGRQFLVVKVGTTRFQKLARCLTSGPGGWTTKFVRFT